MYEYSICTQPDEEIFYKQCKALEKRLQGIKKEKMLQDVDSSLIQPYVLEGKRIVVYNDLGIGAVCIKSDVDLDKYFN